MGITIRISWDGGLDCSFCKQHAFMLNEKDHGARALIFLGEINHAPLLSLVKQLGIPQSSQ